LNPGRFPSGFLGVDAFFVISGYLLTPSIEKVVTSEIGRLTGTLKSFYLRRFARLAPTLICVVFLFSMWMLLFGPLGEQRYAYIQGLTALINLANIEAFRLSQGSYFHPDPNGLLHTWSLSAEEQVFMIVPILLMILHKLFRLSFKRAVVFSLTLLSTFYFIVNFTLIFSTAPFPIGNRDFYYFSPFFRATEFLLGALLVIYSKRENSFSYRKSAILNVLLIATLLAPTSNKFLLPISIIFTLIILANSNGSGQTNSVYIALEKIGDASYSIYLLHLPIIYISKHIANELSLKSWTFALLVPIITLILGRVSYRFIEIPYKRKILNPAKDFKIVKYLSIVVLAILLMGSLRIGATKYYGISTPPTIAGTISCVEGNNVGLCGNLSNNQKKNFLLIGDSHAAALSEVFINEIAKNGGNPIVMFGRGCPLTAENYYLRDSKLTPCQEYVKKVRYFLEENRAILIVAQRSSQELWPNQGSIENEIEAIDLLSQISDKTIVISPNPEFKKGLSQGPTSSLWKLEGKTPKSQMMQASFSNLELLRKSLGHPKVLIFDSTRIFCSDQWCKFKQAGKYLYWDSNHLSREGAKLYQKFFSSLASKNDKTSAIGDNS